MCNDDEEYFEFYKIVYCQAKYYFKHDYNTLKQNYIYVVEILALWFL